MLLFHQPDKKVVSSLYFKNTQCTALIQSYRDAGRCILTTNPAHDPLTDIGKSQSSELTTGLLQKLKRMLSIDTLTTSTTTATTATTTYHSHTAHTLATTPTAAPTVPASDDDVNYYDDDTNNRHYSYEYNTDNHPVDDDFAYSDDHTYSYIGDDLLRPPPSTATTAFPTTAKEGNALFSTRSVCAYPPIRSNVAFTVEQVRLFYPPQCYL